MNDERRFEPWSAKQLDDLRSYHQPCGWSCAASVSMSECREARWLATLDKAPAPVPPPAAPGLREALMALLDEFDSPTPAYPLVVERARAALAKTPGEPDA